ncbi:hypothetical protein OE09_1758 [Flavobacteriaceae bacterium MAR_2010_72]|nr:hypothetical protein OE09_1758 [Flavobacteriaceae bacterium MAR_2010_72]TVZ59523.1 hypothetical protein NA63_2058 [Flavobacteriaceae bacterium MAR_2010_105]
MKKSILFVLGVLLGTIATYFYCCGDLAISDDKIIKPSGVITPAQAKVLDANWTRTRKNAVDGAAGRPDNRSAWWSLDDINNYLVYAENQAGSLGYKMDGIRVYLGVYSGNAPNGRADYTTMFIVPTGKKSHAEANFNFLNSVVQNGKSDIPGADGFNGGDPGQPPSSNYPQQQ